MARSKICLQRSNNLSSLSFVFFQQTSKMGTQENQALILLGRLIVPTFIQLLKEFCLNLFKHGCHADIYATENVYGLDIALTWSQ